MRIISHLSLMNSQFSSGLLYCRPIRDCIHPGGFSVTRRSLFWILISATTMFAAERSFETWSQYLGGADSSQYSSLKQINKSNVRQLEVAWTYTTSGNSLFFDPLVVDGTMY